MDRGGAEASGNKRVVNWRFIPESLAKDVRFAARSLARNPGFTVIAILALTLGIASSISIFTVVNGVLINPLDLPDPDQIVIFLRNTPYGELPMVSFPNFEDWRKQQQTFVDLTASDYTEMNLAGGNSPLRLRGYRVTPDFFRVLGVKPLIGSAFPTETRATSRVAVLSQATWEKGFGSDPRVIGRGIRLDDQAYEICGVVPAATASFAESDVWIPLDPHHPELLRLARRRTGSLFRVLGRVKPGVTLQKAQAEIDVISRRLEKSYPEAREHLKVRLQTLQDHLVGDTRPRLLALMGAVLFVLLIACLNTASLLLTRGTLRAREVAVRMAIGAGRFRVIRQFLIESLLLAVAATVVGMLLAQAAIRLLQSEFPESLPRMAEISIDWHVLGFALVVALLSVFVFGLVPALRSSRVNFGSALKEGASGTTYSSASLRLRSAMVIVQVSLSAILVIGAGLLMKSYWLLTRVELGFRTENIVTAQTVLSSARYKTAEDKIRFAREAEDRLRAIPGVELVGTTNNLTFSNWGFGVRGFEYETADGQRKEAPGTASYKIVGPGFLETLGISLLYGRRFDHRDNAQSAPVLILDRSLAERLFPPGKAVGRRVFFEERWTTVVGVVDSIREGGPLDEPKAALYVPFDQSPVERIGWAIKTAVPPGVMIPVVRRVLSEIDRDQPVFAVGTMRESLATSVVADRLNTLLMLGFGGVALILAALGLYGVLAYQVSSRTREIGIRMAIGAERTQVFRQIATGGLKLVAAGLCLGLAGAVGLTRFLSGMLYNVKPLDWPVFVIVAVLLVCAGVLALAVPAWKASRLSPSSALRTE
ncbi:MAG: ABC transporter permease [Acidobacteria bacterium]|nr:MAG: ABC transporter permease [Acidobacteriota bacterium]